MSAFTDLSKTATWRHDLLASPGQVPVRVALLTNEIPPYRVPKYSQLAATDGWAFKVFTCVDREQGRLWKTRRAFPFEVRRSFSLSYRRQIQHTGAVEFDDFRQVHIPVGLAWDLWRFRPDLIISAEFGVRTLIAAIYARLMRRRLCVYFEGTPHTERNIGPAQRYLRALIRRLADAYFVNGREGRVYLERLGVRSKIIFEIGQATDTDAFSPRATPEDRAAMRARWGIRGHCYLCCGRMVPLKGLDQLLSAWESFSQDDRIEATLLFVGDGPERSRLERRAAAAGLTNVRFLGDIPRSELPSIYQSADVMVFSSLIDCWALVVEEALASGLPIINSIYSGSSERIVEGATGWLLDPLNLEQFVDKLRTAWQARGNAATMAQAARKLSARMSVHSVVSRIRRAVHETLNADRPCCGPRPDGELSVAQVSASSDLSSSPGGGSYVPPG